MSHLLKASQRLPRPSSTLNHSPWPHIPQSHSWSLCFLHLPTTAFQNVSGSTESWVHRALDSSVPFIGASVLLHPGPFSICIALIYFELKVVFRYFFLKKLSHDLPSVGLRHLPQAHTTLFASPPTACFFIALWWPISSAHFQRSGTTSVSSASQSLTWCLGPHCHHPHPHLLHPLHHVVFLLLIRQTDSKLRALHI